MPEKQEPFLGDWRPGAGFLPRGIYTKSGHGLRTKLAIDKGTLAWGKRNKKSFSWLNKLFVAKGCDRNRKSLNVYLVYPYETFAEC